MGVLLLAALLAIGPVRAHAPGRMLSALTVVGTLIADLLLVVMDPRIKLTGSARGAGGTD